MPTGAQQLVLTPTTTLVESAPVPAKLQSIQVVQGQLATISWNMLDRSGDAVDLTAVANLTVQLTIREALSLNGSDPGTVLGGTLGSDALHGLVQATLTMPVVALPGISVAEFAILSAGALVFTNWFFLVVEPSQTGAALAGGTLQDAGTPSLAEVRLYLRDADPAGNLWLASFEWDTAEIAAALVRPIREFNETPPPLNQVWNTSNFPWRHNWLLATTGYLMRLAADWYRRVHLPYQAGGVSLDDKNKFEIYDQRGQELLADWRKWIQWRKVAINAEGAYQTFPGPYSHAGYGDGMGY